MLTGRYQQRFGFETNPAYDPANPIMGIDPAEELYDLRSDPGQIENVASLTDYAEAKGELSDRLERYTQETGDPRALGKDAPWDYYPYYGLKRNQDWTVAGRVLAERLRKPADRVWQPRRHNPAVGGFDRRGRSGTVGRPPGHGADCRFQSGWQCAGFRRAR